MRIVVGIRFRSFITDNLKTRKTALSVTVPFRSHYSSSSDWRRKMGAAASALNEQDKSEISVQLKAKYAELSAESLSEAEIYNKMNK